MWVLYFNSILSLFIYLKNCKFIIYYYYFPLFLKFFKIYCFILIYYTIVILSVLID